MVDIEANIRNSALDSSPSLEATRRFWNTYPCDGQDSYEARCRFRYGKEQWLLPRLLDIASQARKILEVGCGQGTDAITVCRHLPAGSSYTAVDLSEASLDRAREAAQEESSRLAIVPEFRFENAERLSFADASFDFVYSMGVLHHTDNIDLALGEFDRVLRPGGTALVCLYRTYSPKILLALALRRLQKCLDRLLGTERIILRLSNRLPVERLIGTALQECFGVPILRSYTERQVRELFKDFVEVRVGPVGFGSPPSVLGRAGHPGRGGFGYLYVVEANKPL